MAAIRIIYLFLILPLRLQGKSKQTQELLRFSFSPFEVQNPKNHYYQTSSLVRILEL